MNELTEDLSRPSPALVADAAGWRGDVVVLGAGGKTGTGIATMARRALDAADRRDVTVHAVSRWSSRDVREGLETVGVRTVAADAADTAELAELPDAAELVFLVGAKFGTSGAPEDAVMTNTVLPDHVARRFADARITALSTGNVYGTVPAVSGGSVETDEPHPLGDYATTCRGRELVFTHAARHRGTPVALIRLNYAVEERYGVLADLARKLLAAEPVDVGAGAVNVVGQRYANEVVLRSLNRASAPEPFVLNLTGPETIGIRTLASRLAELLGVDPEFTGTEPVDALLSDATRCHTLFGYPDRTLGELVERQAKWMLAGGTVWDKPTKFERRDGRF